MSKNWGAGLSQEQLMIKDECILVDENDKILGHTSKKDAHIFNAEKPYGQLHRAFSVFLFNEDGELLLQQRAADKITFPSVWTNTCCSHPLYGFTPDEVDQEGESEGVKNAAIRKLAHELGVSTRSLKVKDFKFLTRLHYWAADVVTHGPQSPWGEHEVDYILFIQKNVKIKPNPEEVMDTKYVTLKELQKMMKPSSGLLWSPWFRIIAEKFLPHWWEDLDTTLNTDKFVDWSKIHHFDPTEEHCGGQGNAKPFLGSVGNPYGESNGNGNGNTSSSTASNAAAAPVGNTALKQGSYGKVKIHKHSKLDQISRIDEIFAAVYFKYVAVMPNKVNLKDENVKFCDDMLGKVSRSFAAVIRQLPKGLCIDILIFYLALRALDTIEDDMEAFKGKEHVKIDHLNNFYRTGLVTDGWSMQGVGAGDERTLLEQYHRCVTVFKMLSPASQEVIADITKRMGQGMASYVSKDLGQGTVKISDYDLYCHYVAGLVGEGLSRLFTATGYESEQVAAVSKTLANTMGLFLQKTNIIRDYLEDFVDGRAFWPKEIWGQYTKTGNLGELAEPQAREAAVQCLNHLVTNALECVPECLQYMNLLKTEEVFRFCAIPQVMAIATLSELYNNPKVFTGVVKIRKGQAAQLILDTKTMGGLHKWFNLLTRSILSRVPDSDPSAENTRAICRTIIEMTDKQGQMALAGNYAQVAYVISSILIAITSYSLFGVHALKTGRFDFKTVFTDFVASPNKTSGDHLMLLVFLVSVLFVFGYSIVASGRVGLKRADP